VSEGLEIWWIRHGESLWNRQGRWQGHSDIDLSPVGEEQARKLSRRLESIAFDRVYSSDLRRARHTAELALPCQPPQADQRLRELHFGSFEGRSSDEFDEEAREQLQQWLRDPFGLRIPGGESMSDVRHRVGQWFEQLPSVGRLAVFTHGGVIRSEIWHIVGPPQENRWTVQIENTSITRIRYAKRISLERINDCSHLEDDAGA
jgi:broad specificity phosphatase PhoE